MPKISALKNFPDPTILFLKKLTKNNNREWFDQNKEMYLKSFMEPAQVFVSEMGEKLFEISPYITAIPKIDKSIFRIYRDVRFSKDKSPYKTHLGIYFWEGGKKMESPGFYFHIEPKEIFIGAGLYTFTKELLTKYREIISSSNKADGLNAILKSILKNKKYSLGGKNLKKIPRGFDPNSKYADLFLHDSIYIYYKTDDPSEIKNKDAINYVYKIFKDLSPLHKWLVKNLSIKSI